MRYQGVEHLPVFAPAAALEGDGGGAFDVSGFVA